MIGAIMLAVIWLLFETSSESSYGKERHMEQLRLIFPDTVYEYQDGLLIIAGTFAGIYIGAIPGLSVTMAVSVLITFTFSWDVNAALSLMAGIYCGGVYGGSRSAILLNIPGAPAAVATGFDGYPLAKLGEAGNAIGLSTTASVIGGYHRHPRPGDVRADHLGIRADVRPPGLLHAGDHGAPPRRKPGR